MPTAEQTNPLEQWVELVSSRLGLSQARIAKVCGFSQDYFNKIIKETRRQSGDKLGKIAEALTNLLGTTVSPNDLLHPPSNEVLKKVAEISGPQSYYEARESDVDWRDVLVEDVLEKMPGGHRELIERAAKAEARRRASAPRPIRRLKTEK